MKKLSVLLAVPLLATFLASCESQKPEDVPPPPPSPPDILAPPAEAVPPADPAPAPAADPASAPQSPAQPAPAAPPPTEPSPAPTPTAASTQGPALESMSLATPPAKLSVAVDLRYHFDSAVVENKPVKLHLAAVPRVPGTNFTVQIRKMDGVDVENGGLIVEKVDAAGVYRKEMTVIRRANAPQALRVLVTMDVPEGAGFGFFSIPLNQP